MTDRIAAEPAAPPRGSVRARRASARRINGTIIDALRSVSQVAAEVAKGEDAGLVLVDVGRRLIELLDLTDCSFEVPPFDRPMRPVLRHDGDLELRGVTWDPSTAGLPTAGFHLPVVAREQMLGRFRCIPRHRYGIPRERLLAAVALADQTAAALLISGAP